MQVPLQVSFRHLEYSPYVASAIRRRADGLEKYYPRITSLRVLVETSQHRRRRGNLYHVRIDMTVPGGEIIVRRSPGDNEAHKDVYVAIRDAFDAARRQLEDYVRIHYRGKQKYRVEMMHGMVSRIFPNEDCGFLTAQDGREIYFHRNSVFPGEFDQLTVGEEVRFAEEQGNKGPQATTLTRVGKEGHRRQAA